MSVFNTHYADQYDRLYAQKDYRLECDLIESAVKKFAASPPATVLDVGCGTGQHAIELASRGFQLTGVDLSDAMLQHAERKAGNLPIGSRPRWLQGDARNFSAGGEYDLGIMMFAVIGYLTRNEDVLAALRNIRKHLKPGALFVCDFWHGPAVLSDRPTDRVKVIPTSDGEVIRATQTVLNIAEQTAEVRFQLWEIADSRLVERSTESHSMRYFFPQEFALFLSIAGFEMANISAFPTIDQPITDTAWNALAVARAV